MRRVSPIFCLIALCGLPGCVLLNTPRPRAEATASVEIPVAWASAAKGNQGRISTGWVKSFRDAEMNRMIEEALQNNQDLQAAAARLRSARQGVLIGRAGRLPDFGASGRTSLTRRNELFQPDPITTTIEVPVDPPPPPADGSVPPIVPATRTETITTTPEPFMRPVTTTNFGLSLDVSWEVDLWSRLRDLHHAAYHDYVAAVADFRSARLSLAANTAKAWYNLITAHQQVELALATLDSFERNRRITERNYKAGDDSASPLDVQFGRTNVAAAERALINSRLGRDEAARPLQLLLGRYPDANLKPKTELPTLKGAIPAGLPSELLARRPDLTAGAARVIASAKRASAARKSLLPSLNLTGNAATATEGLRRMLVDPDEIVWNAAASIAQTIYRGGAPSAQVRQAFEQNEAAIREYASLVLNAFREVESALATERSLADQEKFLDIELSQATLAENQASRDYADGIVGILEVLEAQRRAVNARNSMILLRNQRLQNRIDLHLALGGDFKTLAPAGP